jgi:transposase
MALIAGIDLGRKSAHDVAILRKETGKQVKSTFRFTSTPEGIVLLFHKIEAVRQNNEPIEFVIDSPGKAWIPIAAVLKARDLQVYRPSADRVNHVRKAGHRKNKTNRIDALTLARCLLNYPDDSQQVFLPAGPPAKLDQLVRQRDRIVDSLRRRKQRIQDLCEAVNPGLAKATGDFLLTEPGRAFLRSYLDPRAVVRLGLNRLTRFLQDRYRLPLKPQTAQDIFQACKDAVELYLPVRDKGLIPFDEAALQDEMGWELDQLEREEERLHTLESQIKKLNTKLDSQRSINSLPGIADILAAGIQSCVGDIDRFDSLEKHRGYAGLYPSSRATGDHRVKGTSISKMSSNRYKRYLYLAAENAYKWDVEMAAFYHKRRQAGQCHTQAVCAVANAKLLPRIHSLMKQLKQARINHTPRPHYVFRDLSGNPISKAEARAIIQAKWGEVSYSQK